MGSPIDHPIGATTKLAMAATPAKGKTATPSDLKVGGFGAAHPSVCNFLFGDGAVRSLGDDTSLKVLQQLGNRADAPCSPKAPRGRNDGLAGADVLLALGTAVRGLSKGRKEVRS